VKLRFTPRATRDIAEIAEYLRIRNPSAALAVRDAILRSPSESDAFSGDRSSPKCRRRPQALVMSKYRYLVYYTIDERAEEIVILRIQHPARSRESRDA
jgi:toxin ParE1/3/4